MFFSLLLTALLATAPAPAAEAPVAKATHAAGPLEPCKIFGSVYLETDPARRSYCYGTVYVEPEEAFADVLVFKENNKLFADKAGLWADAPARDFADYVLLVVKDRSRADFSIHYTTVRSFAGCKQN
ncbi:hypothetical protein [Hymenobacter properus]|uniref:7(1) septoil knot domain-containing protein n=1 Tax=Hymenobacter properus TaxID=2791026 RepID=A0A931BJE0_9BACT|nr:hypothetical protein [Hymenobacter properus]MBF9142432.1 hypothetical protein [Hymenobacter properus]MBR7721239.1 hypothetical protein [Microvirga sp. SRT04]